MKNVYEALRNGPRWNKTLLLITYDEHGGFYDHVAPPQTGVPNPDGKNAFDAFVVESGCPIPLPSPLRALLRQHTRGGTVFESSSLPLVRVLPTDAGIDTKEGFPYTRLGVRIPTIAVSPWIQRGTLVHEAPDAQKPNATSEYELSSVPVRQHQRRVCVCGCTWFLSTGKTVKL